MSSKMLSAVSKPGPFYLLLRGERFSVARESPAHEKSTFCERSLSLSPTRTLQNKTTS